MNGIGILPGYRPQYIDHLVPLCHLLEIPLLVTDERIETLVTRYYPPLEIIVQAPEDYILNLDSYDLLVYVEYARLATGAFQFHEYHAKTPARSLISLHGNPDKYHNAFWLERLNDEDLILAYGPQLIDLLRSKGVSKEVIRCGNYRLAYYEEHKAFFDARCPIQEAITLYAPTWNNPQLSLDDVPEGAHVKLHPLTPHEEFPLSSYPPIYPLLSRVEKLIGDYSSIGYDFLYFDRPLEFIHTAEKTPLHAATTSQQRQELYTYAFGDAKPLDELKEEIIHAL